MGLAFFCLSFGNKNHNASFPPVFAVSAADGTYEFLETMEMKIRYARVVAAVLAFLLCSFPGFSQQSQNSSQQQEQKKRKSASLDGTTGLFKTWDAETLRQGEFNLSAGFDHFNRDPGELTIKRVPGAFAVGLIDRLEIFGWVDVQRRVRTLSSETYRVLPGQLPRPAQTQTGLTYFTNDAPFIDVPVATGRGDTHLGLKLNLLSERLGSPLGMGVAGFVTIPGQKTITGLNRGLSTGAYQGGFMYLVSKRAGRIAQLHLNTGLNFVNSPDNVLQPLTLQNEFLYRAGAAFPTYGMVQIIAEIAGKTYFGDRAPLIENPRSPVDLIIGLRGYPRDWISIGAGYQASFNHVKEDATNGIFPASINGFVAQLALGRRVNDPPVVTCAVSNPSIKQDDTTTIRANAHDPDGDPLTYSWSSSGGKITGSGDTATFDATGVAPGKYTVTVTVSDGKHKVDCATEITVIKRNLPPTVSCEPGSVTITQGESTTIRTTASDPNKDALTYSWTVNGQSMAAAGPTFTFGSEGREPGDYKVAVTVSDGELTASCTTVVTVKQFIKPNQNPTIQCLTTTVDVASGGTAELRVQASDPDNDPLTVAWSSTGGTVSGTGMNGTFNATELKAGRYVVTATCDDGRGGKASCSMTVNVTEKIVLVCGGKTRGGNFAPGGTHVDNCAKAMLDDLATRMKNDPQLFANVIGYTDGSRLEKSRKALGERRAKAVVQYLVKKGVDASRLTATDGDANNPIGDNKTAAGRKQNRRVEIELTVR